jgi:hypothetical protein
MIKFLKNQDIQITTFAVAKKNVANNIFNDLILASDGTYDFPLIIPIQECDYNYNSLQTGSFASLNYNCAGGVYNTNGFLASSQFTDQNNPAFRLGLKVPSSSVFYPVGDTNYNPLVNPTNLDGTYQGQVYNTVKNMYYNNYNNAYQQFGFDGYDTSLTELNLDDKFISYTLNITQSGDRIRPKSVLINNQTGDIVAYIVDDGNHNLYLTGSYFVNSFELNTNNTSSTVNYCYQGLGRYLCS